jgi:hypothetical protein
MSIGLLPGRPKRDSSPGIRRGLVRCGIALGLLCLCASAAAGGAEARHPLLYGVAGLPDPAAITAYTAAVCGSIVTAVNTALLVLERWEGRRKRRRRRRDEKDGKGADAQTGD